MSHGRDSAGHDVTPTGQSRLPWPFACSSRSIVIDTRILARATAPLVYLALTGVAEAGTISAQGNVTALDDITQIPSVTGVALFDEQFSGMIPLDQYAGVGLTFHTGEL